MRTYLVWLFVVAGVSGCSVDKSGLAVNEPRDAGASDGDAGADARTMDAADATSDDAYATSDAMATDAESDADSADACTEGESTDMQCSDGIDNDCDGKIDCEEDSCDGEACQRDGTLCGVLKDCHVCQEGTCVLNEPHFDESCRPSCGAAKLLCDTTGRCCSGGECPTVGSLPAGSWKDCSVCCAADMCF